MSATFVQTGQASRRPWDFYWWAKKGDYVRDPLDPNNSPIGNGVANTTALATDVQNIPVGQPAGPLVAIVLCGTDGTLETTATPDDEAKMMINLFDKFTTYRPLDKYDQLHGGSPRAWEAAYDGGMEDWEGHCLGGAMASILLNQPSPRSPYNRDEMEGLWAELGEHDETIYQYDPNHLVYGVPPGPPVSGFDETDQWVASLHARLEDCIRHEHVSLQSNLRATGGNPNQEWNHAIYKFTATYSEAPGGNERVVHIVSDLAANRDHMPPTDDVADRAFNYTYVVRYLCDGAVDAAWSGADFIAVGGEAHFAPGNLLHVISAGWGHHNPGMAVGDVGSMPFLVEIANGSARYATFSSVPFA